MGKDVILDADCKPITGTSFVGDKHALDVNVLGSVGLDATIPGIGTAIKTTEITTINSTTWTTIVISPLTGRQTIGVQNQTGVQIKINALTPAGYVGWILEVGGEKFYDIADTLSFNIKSASGSGLTVMVEELA